MPSCWHRRVQPSWGWLVVAGGFIVNFLNIGTLKSFGVLLPHLVNGLNSSTSIIGLGLGLSHGLSVGLAILTNQLMKVMSVRKLVLAGGLLGGLGISACALVKNSGQFTAATMTAAIGYGLVTLSIRVTIVKHFPERYFIPTSLMLTGGGVGMMALPPLTETLVEIYGWRGALLILGGLNFHTMVAGVVLRPHPTYRDEQTHLPSGCRVTYSTLKEGGEVDLGDTQGPPTSDDNRERTPKDERLLSKSQDSPFSNICTYVVAGFKNVGKTFDLKIFVDYPLFSLIIVAVCLHGMTYTGWIVFLVPNGEAKGYPPSVAVKLAAIGGAANIVGRLSVGFIVHCAIGLVSPEAVFVATLLLSGVAFGVNPLANAFWALCVVTTLNGFSNGAKTVLITIICRSSVPPERFSTALSFAMFVRGFSEPLGGLITGSMFDATHSYDQAFLVLGCLDISGAILIIVARCIAQKSTK